MKLRRKPPAHRIDAPIIFIHSGDEAWDQDAITKSEEEHGESCPFLRYHRGDTRYDIGDLGPTLKGQAVEFHLRRLSVGQLNEVQDLLEREYSHGSPMTRMAYLQAARYGLTAVKRSGTELIRLQCPGGLTEPDMEALRDLSDLGINLIRTIGQAVYLASQPLREDEKKH